MNDQWDQMKVSFTKAAEESIIRHCKSTKEKWKHDNRQRKNTRRMDRNNGELCNNERDKKISHKNFRTPQKLKDDVQDAVRSMIKVGCWTI